MLFTELPLKKRSDDFLKLSQQCDVFCIMGYAVGPVTQYRKVHRTFLPNFFALLKIWTLVFESLHPKNNKKAIR